MHINFVFFEQCYELGIVNRRAGSHEANRSLLLLGLLFDRPFLEIANDPVTLKGYRGDIIGLLPSL
ncbi:MAG: hypothetical protein IBX56_07455 [Methylomicrobium sp.]|nr:hypothetical protein [Methylomicrobium sp.]